MGIGLLASKYLALKDLLARGKRNIKMDKHVKDSINVCGTIFNNVVPYLRTYSINLKAHDETSFRVARNICG